LKVISDTPQDYNQNYASGDTGPSLSNIFQTDKGLNILTTEPSKENIISIGSSRRALGISPVNHLLETT